MQVTETLSEGLKRGFTVVVPAADIEGQRARRLAELGKTLRLPGFRPGKVPPTVVRQRYGQAVTAEVLEQSVNDATQQVLTDRNMRTAGRPKVEVVSLPAPRDAVEKDLEFKVELELLPEIALPDLAAIELTRLKAEPNAETIDRALAQLAERQRKLEDVTDPRPAEPGDVLTIDYSGTIEGAAFAGGTGTDMTVEVGGPGFLPGFTEQLAGLSPGESKRIEAAFPPEYPAKELAGKTASFEVTAKKLQRAVVPPVDEALAQQLGFDEGLEELRKVIATRVQREYDQLSRHRLKRELLDALAVHAAFPVPEGMLEAEFGQIWERVEADRKQGQLDGEDAAKDEATLRAEYRAIAERRVRLGLLLAEIGRTNGITVSAEEMNRAVRAEAGRFPGEERKVLEFFRKYPQAAETLRAPLFEDKVVDFILELARVSERGATPEELAEEPPAPAAITGAGQVAAAAPAEAGPVQATEPPAAEPPAAAEPQPDQPAAAES
jgi:trigger factor